MPRDPKLLTPEQAMEKLQELAAMPGVEGYMFALVVDDQRVGIWGSGTERGALGAIQGASELQTQAAGWLAHGGMRPGPQTH